MIKTGIYGGSFNTIHNGHIALAQHIMQQAGLDEIWFVVSPQNPLKPSSALLDDSLRLDMVRKALEPYPGLVASDVEFSLPRPSYMWHTLQSLTHFTDRSFSLIIGADNWECFDRWYRAADIVAHYSIVVYPREGCDIDTATLPPTAISFPQVWVSAPENSVTRCQRTISPPMPSGSAQRSSSAP